MKASDGLFLIKRNRKMLVAMAIAGLIICLLGGIFLYSSIIMPSGFCKWVGIIAVIAGLILIYRGMVYFNIPLVVADSSGIQFDIALLGNRIYIPWNGIRKIEKEDFGMLALKWKSRTPCLVFEIDNEYLSKIPTLLKSAYYKSGNRIYFASGLLSITVDDAIDKLRSIQRR